MRVKCSSNVPNEKGWQWTFAAALYAGCGPACCGDARDSSVRCSISFCGKKRKHQGLGAYGYHQSSTNNNRKETILSVHGVSRQSQFHCRQATALKFHLRDNSFLLHGYIWASMLVSIKLTYSCNIILQQFHSLLSVALVELNKAQQNPSKPYCRRCAIIISTEVTFIVRSYCSGLLESQITFLASNVLCDAHISFTKFNCYLCS